MQIALLQNDKSFLSFDLKDLLWLILVVGVWATQDYRIKYTSNVLRWNEELQEKNRQQSQQIAQAILGDQRLVIYLGRANDDFTRIIASKGVDLSPTSTLMNCNRAFEHLRSS